MLQNIREHVQGWFAGVIIALIALSFIFFGIESYLKADNPNLATVAVVNGDKITAQQLQERYRRLLDQIPNANALEEKARQKIQQEALTQLVNERALLQMAHDLGLDLNFDELRTTIASMPAFQENGRFSVTRFNQVLIANHLSVTQFEQQISDMLLLNQLQNAIQSTAFALPAEVQQNYALLEQDRDIGYFEVSAKNVATSFHPTEEQIQAYYQKHQAEFMNPEQVSIEYVELSPLQLAEHVKLSDAELRDYYQQHSTNFPKDKSFATLKPSIMNLARQEKTEQLLAQKSEDLANLSFTHPDSLQDVADSLGLPIQKTGLFTKQGMTSGLLSDPKLVATAFSSELLEQGVNSNPIEVKEGSLVVLRVNKHVPASVKPLLELRTFINGELLREQASKNTAKLAEKIKKALNNGAPVAEVAKQYHLVWALRHSLKQSDSTLAPTLIEAAFKTPMDSSGNSKAQILALASGDYVVFKLLAQRWGPSAELSADKQKQWLEQMAARQAQIEYRLYEQGVIKQAKFEFKASESSRD